MQVKTNKKFKDQLKDIFKNCQVRERQKKEGTTNVRLKEQENYYSSTPKFLEDCGKLFQETNTKPEVE